MSSTNKELKNTTQILKDFGVTVEDGELKLPEDFFKSDYKSDIVIEENANVLKPLKIKL